MMESFPDLSKKKINKKESFAFVLKLTKKSISCKPNFKLQNSNNCKRENILPLANII